MKRKTAAIISSFAILVSFFFPIFNWHSYEMSGLNYILSSHIPSYKYVLLFIPFSALLLFWGAMNDEKYLFNKEILSWMPLLSLAFILIMRYADGTKENSFYDTDSVFSTLEIGFWLVLFFSILLVYIINEKKILYPNSKS